MSFKKLVLLVALFVIYVSMYAEITRNDAVDLVLNQIISEDVGKVNVYIKNNPVSSDIGLNLHKGRHIDTSYNSSWIFFVDDNPAARWFHPCRYIAIDTQTGEYEIFEESIYPANEYQDFELISSPPDPETTSTQITPPLNSPTQRTDNSHLYAVIIGGDLLNDPTQWDDDESFWNDTSGIYCTLLNYGYTRDNIIVHYAEGEGPDGNQDLDDPNEYTDDIDYWADKDTIFTTFDDLQTILTPQDMLFIYLNDHGYHLGDVAYLCLPGRDVPSNRLYDYELAELTRNIDCSQIIFRIDCCYSGGFINDLDDPIASCQNRVIHTMCGFEHGYGERWITSPSYGLYPKYSEFNLYWTAAAREWYPYIDPDNHQLIEAWHEYIETGIFPFMEYSTWSNPAGYPTHNDYPDYHPDEDEDNGNNDGFVQMWEIFRYANNWDSFSNDTDQTYNSMPGYFNPFSDNTYPPRVQETPQQFPEEPCFLNKFLTLAGISGTLSVSDFGLTPEITGNYLFSEEFRIEDGITLTVTEGSQITFSDETNIFLENGAELIIEAEADIVIGDDVKFSTPDGEESGVVRILGSSSVNCNNLEFSNCELHTTDTRLEIYGGNFTESRLRHLNEILILDDIDFEQTSIFAEKRTVGPALIVYVNIENCTIQNSVTYAVFISSYPFFNIYNNTIIENEGTAINLYTNTNGTIENNYIVNNGAGIYLNNTEVEIIDHNVIQDNGEHGIVALNYSNWSLVGQNDYPCQIVFNNYGNEAEIWFNTTSKPDEVIFNKIYDSNYESEFIHCSGILYRVIDVTNNFWGNGAVGGNSRIPTEENLYPFESYVYEPVWNPGIPRGGEDSDAEIMYLSGKEFEVNENYDAAEQTYKDVITLYPASNYSKMSAKQLISIAEKTDQDFLSLKDYYDNEPNMTFDEEMTKVSSFLSNLCNIKTAEFITSIGWFEDVISNPPSQIDSVLAVIDLGYTYLLMEANGGRCDYTGRFAHLKPSSWEEFEENRIQLLNDLFGEPEIEPEEEPSSDIIPACVTLHRNYPNPFNPTTAISFSIPEESKIDLSVYNIKGQKVRTLTNNNFEKGNHSIVWNGRDDNDNRVSSGLYFYKLSSGKSSAMKKMLLLK